MKKALLWLIPIAVVTLLGTYYSISSFVIRADLIALFNFKVEQNEVQFEVRQMSGFYKIIDYTYYIEDDSLCITFYGSYLLNQDENKSISQVNIKPNCEINRIIGKSKEDNIVWWENNNIKDY